MKRWAMLGILCVAAFLLSGCIFVVAGNSNEVAYPPGASAKSVTAQEIDAAGALDFDSSRVVALQRIARQPDLSPVDQVYFVEVVFHRVTFSSNRELLMRDLINNPAFSDDGKRAVLARLKNLDFDSSRSAILEELHNHPTNATATPAVPVTPVVPSATTQATAMDNVPA